MGARFRPQRLGVALALLLPLGLGAARDVGAEPARSALTLWVDDDDDDLDGVPDREAASLSGALGDERLVLPSGAWALPPGSASPVALFQGDQRLTAGKPARRGAKGALLAQGLRPGEVTLHAGTSQLDLRVLQAYRVDDAGWAAPAYGSVRRTLPVVKDDPERFALGVAAPSGALPAALWLTSYTAEGRQLDQLGPLAVAAAPCPEEITRERALGNSQDSRLAPHAGAPGGEPSALAAPRGAPAAPGDSQDSRLAAHAGAPGGEPSALSCGVTDQLSLVGMLADRLHPSLSRALRVAIDGRATLDVAAAPSPLRAAGSLHVVGPDLGAGVPRRGTTKLRVHVLRQAPGGSPAVGGHDRGALQVMTRELEQASALFAQCGVSFELASFRVVDPSPPHLLAFGCERGALTGGGQVALEVDGRRLEVALPPGRTPLEAAQLTASAVRRLGYHVEISRNATVSFASHPSVDLLVYQQGGAPAVLTPLSVDGRARPIATDSALGVCLGEVDLSDGLSHFTDFSSGAGTLEERSLLKALSDDDPTSVEVVVIPSFAGSGRIGESFIFSDGTGLRSAVIVDHAGLRAGSQSFVLAHELGHVLLALPGHPDDFGVDDPSHLMDSDASEPSSFGPRRLKRGDCQRLWRQSGGIVTPRRTGVPTLDAPPSAP